MKKALVYALSLALLFSLAACNKPQAEGQPDTSVSTSTQAEPSKTPTMEMLSDTTPTTADASGLDSDTKQAYYDVLTAEINKYGIVSKSGGSGLEYAALEDMDANGTPELIVIRYVDESTANINVWTVRNDKVVQAVNESVSAGGTLTEASIFLVRRSGQVAVCSSFEWYERGYEWAGGEDLLAFQLYYADGTTEKISTDKNSEIETTRMVFRNTWTIDDFQFTGGVGQWLHEDRATETVRQAQTALSPQESRNNTAPAAGTYGPYTIKGSNYTITFSAAMVEEKTIKCVYLSGSALDPDRESSERHTVITLQPDSFISISGGNAPDIYYNGRYVIGTAGYIKNGSYYFGNGETYLGTGIAGDVFSSSDAVCKLEDGSIIVALSTDFTDIELGAYYSDAVKWAVDHKIASGTTTTTFSPDQTCTVAQILSFIWRANGSPEPTAANPFTDIKASDYYYKAALWAAEKGLVTGNKLNPDTPCTRAMTMEYLWKAAGRPTVQSEDYKPFTITEEAWDGSTCVITFDAASVKQSTVRLCDDQFGSVVEVEHNEMDISGMLITVPFGSRVKIDNPSGADFPWGADGIDMKWYYSDSAGSYHSDPGVSSETLSSGDVIIDNAIARFYMNGTTYLLKASSAPSAFADVPANAEYAQAVAWAVENGITSGTGNGQFSPDTTCTRGQIMTFLYRAMGN